MVLYQSESRSLGKQRGQPSTTYDRANVRMVWCAVVLGGLVRRRPVESMSCNTTDRRVLAANKRGVTQGGWLPVVGKHRRKGWGKDTFEKKMGGNGHAWKRWVPHESATIFILWHGSPHRKGDAGLHTMVFIFLCQISFPASSMRPRPPRQVSRY